MRWRRPAVSGCTATSWPACETRTFPPATTTCTLSPNRRQCRRLLALEPCQRRFASGAMHPLVGDLAHPPVEVPLQRRPADEVMPGDGVALDIADAALVLAFCAGSVRCASARMEAPMVGKGEQTIIEPYLAGGRVMVIHQRPRIVEQHL